MGFSDADIEELVAVLAAVLHLGNCVFVDGRDASQILSMEVRMPKVEIYTMLHLYTCELFIFINYVSPILEVNKAMPFNM